MLFGFLSFGILFRRAEVVDRSMRVLDLDAAAVVAFQRIAPIGNGKAVFERLDYGAVVHPLVVAGLFSVFVLVRRRQVSVPVVLDVNMAFAAFGFSCRRPGDREILLVFDLSVLGL